MTQFDCLRYADYLPLLAKRVVELEQINCRLQGKINELLQDIHELLSEKHELEDK